LHAKASRLQLNCGIAILLLQVSLDGQKDVQTAQASKCLKHQEPKI